MSEDNHVYLTLNGQAKVNMNKYYLLMCASLFEALLRIGNSVYLLSCCLYFLSQGSGIWY